jgi:hypothetical protein
MNVIVSPYGQKGFYCRSDSTLLRAISDYYIPDYVRELSLSPVFVIKTMRSGKAISEKFAARYIDSSLFGVLLHPVIDEKYGAMTPFMENSLDYTSIIPLDSFPFNDENLNKYKFSVEIDYGESTFEIKSIEKETVFEKIKEISQFCSLKIGDFIVFDMAPKIKISAGSNILGTLNGDKLLEFKIR